MDEEFTIKWDDDEKAQEKEESEEEEEQIEMKPPTSPKEIDQKGIITWGNSPIFQF